jgi:antitoxin (DNA-binding transcriptional repressor) of toxin-antitoxin stability system
MRVGVAEVRKRLREIMSRVDAGETVEISRRGEVVARMAPPAVPGQRDAESFAEVLASWRSRWGVDTWPDGADTDNPFDDVRDRSAGRAAPW